MAKWVCTVCGYVYEGEACSGRSVRYAKLRLSKFNKQEEANDLGCRACSWRC